MKRNSLLFENCSTQFCPHPILIQRPEGCCFVLSDPFMQVFTTCGSQAKKDFLLSKFGGLKAENIGDSRSCSFENLIMQATQNQGVHLILNSLADDKLQVTCKTKRLCKEMIFGLITVAELFYRGKALKLLCSGQAFLHGSFLNVLGHMQASVRCLSDRGRLLEIGKYDILKGTPLSMRPLLRNIAYDGIDLDRVFNDHRDTHEVCPPRLPSLLM